MKNVVFERSERGNCCFMLGRRFKLIDRILILKLIYLESANWPDLLVKITFSRDSDNKLSIITASFALVFLFNFVNPKTKIPVNQARYQ